jgi:hypothetical protein
LQLGANIHLVYITSSQEDVAVAALGGGTLGRSWMGATDVESEGQWHWLDATSFPPSTSPDVTMQRWNSGEPNNGNGSFEEDCGSIDLSTGGWDDRRCTETRPSVCEEE